MSDVVLCAIGIPEEASGCLMLARSLLTTWEKTTMTILVIHGAGMNMRGKVQTEVFGTLTLP
jgi:hypothetical protein